MRGALGLGLGEGDAMPSTIRTILCPVNLRHAAHDTRAYEIALHQAQLQNVLTYHVVPGAITSDQILGRRVTVETVQGGTLTVNGQVGKVGNVRVNNADVIVPDIIASNGVIHAIDSVLLP